ncbi:MAG: filamentous hemagglutinin N-terminal domain-containing protein [Rhodocyclales bacterium]|nr:filamentous hemagglutinin N-terminal domain-containing protein [Rhodocyclales bacterium]
MKTLLINLLAGTMALAGPAWAVDLPTGAAVQAGSATFSQAGNALTVTNSNRAIINWTSFSVGAGGSVQFVQPGASSAVLNRVVAANPSLIYGPVTSNGQVFLVNPNGIIVGPSGRIDAAGIFLSTGNISNADFLGGSIRFEPPTASTPIVISGRVEATDRLDIKASSLDCSNCTLVAPTISLDTGTALPPTQVPTLPVIPPVLSLPALPPTGNITVGGSVTLTAGTVNIQQSTQKLLQRTGGAISLRSPVAPGPIAPMPQGALTLTATPPATNAPVVVTAPLPVRRAAPAVSLNSGGLVDGVVTVRMSLVDASPITLR